MLLVLGCRDPADPLSAQGNPHHRCQGLGWSPSGSLCCWRWYPTLRGPEDSSAVAGDGAGPCSFCSLLERSRGQAAAGGAGTRRNWEWAGWVIPTDGVGWQQWEPTSPWPGRGSGPTLQTGQLPARSVTSPAASLPHKRQGAPACVCPCPPNTAPLHHPSCSRHTWPLLSPLAQHLRPPDRKSVV